MLKVRVKNKVNLQTFIVYIYISLLFILCEKMEILSDKSFIVFVTYKYLNIRIYTDTIFFFSQKEQDR